MWGNNGIWIILIIILVLFVFNNNHDCDDRCCTNRF